MFRAFAQVKSFQRYINNRAPGREQEAKRWLLTKFRINGHPHARVVRAKKFKQAHGMCVALSCCNITAPTPTSPCHATVMSEACIMLLHPPQV